MHVLAREDLGELFHALEEAGYGLVGPRVRDGAIVYDELASPADLPVGVGDEQSPGRYRLRDRGDQAYFGYVVGPHSWKKYLFPSRETLYKTRSVDGALVHETVGLEAAPKAFIGVRACEVAAIAVQDQVFMRRHGLEPRYAGRRNAAFLVAVNCGEPGGLCFCASMGTGPRAKSGADLVLTELPDKFLVEAQSERGTALLASLPMRDATDDEAAEVGRITDAAALKMGRTLDTANLPQVLFGNRKHVRWEEVANRCLSCGNCTSVCPTCFCSSVEEVSDLDGKNTERVRVWDTCFGSEHSTIHGATYRPATKERYQQWLTHKFGSWQTQFGTSGCVGCGRCITWCPPGIDVTEELAALRVGTPEPVVIPNVPAPPESAVHDLVPHAGAVMAVERDTADVVTLRVAAGAVPFAGHGQFNMIGLPGIGEVPISVSGTDGGVHVHTIRAVGAATKALCELEPGAFVQIRGPYGSVWPLDAARGRPVVIVTGGIGLAPLRTAIRAMVADPVGFPDVRLFIGARAPDDLLFRDEVAAWASAPHVKVAVTVDRAGADWHGDVGVVTRLLTRSSVPAGAAAFVCGPEIMMKFARKALVELGVPDDSIWVSMERHMKCAAGFCGRCQYAHWFICKDGPVFRFDTLAPVFGHDGF